MRFGLCLNRTMIQPDLFSNLPLAKPRVKSGRKVTRPDGPHEAPFPREPRQSATAGRECAGREGLRDGKGAKASRNSPEAGPAPTLDMPAILETLSACCDRPRYCFMVLGLIVRAGGRSGSAGPWVREGGRAVPVRDWLCEALAPVARRDPRRLSIADRVRAQLAARGDLPSEPEAAQRLIDEGVRERIRLSGRTNVSRAVSQLVRAGLVRRHYQGYRVDHENRGAQRQAVYCVSEEVRRAMGA